MSSTISMLGCDGFLLALDHLMRRTGQGAHLSQTVVELDQAPEMDVLSRAWSGFIDEHPIVRAQRGRSWRNGLPVWRLGEEGGHDAASAMTMKEVGLWHEQGAAVNADDPGSRDRWAAQEVQSLETLCRERRTRGEGAPAQARGPSLQLDVLLRADGSAAVVMSWSHLLVDGKGVELVFAELGRRCRGQLSEPTPSVPMGGHGRQAGPGNEAESAKAGSTVSDQIRRSRAFANHFANLQKTRFSSLGGPKPFAGPVSSRVVTLDGPTTQAVNERAKALTSQLITTPFYLAAAAVAHGRVFEHRGQSAGPQIITLPVQIRPKGGAGPLFQNYVTILFFKLEAQQIESVESATLAIRKQFAQMMRDRLDTSFTKMLDLMRWMPPAVYAWFLRRQMHGEITSFFHSYTGAFAPPQAPSHSPSRSAAGSAIPRPAQSAGQPTAQAASRAAGQTQAQVASSVQSPVNQAADARTSLTAMAGAKVTNAWHIPVISTPPGTGLFLGQYDDRLSISMSWRDGAIDEAEQEVLLSAFLAGLAGEPIENYDLRLRC